MGDYSWPDQYNSTPRKVFDKYIDRMAVKRQRDREDHRNDMQTIVQRMNRLETQLTLIAQHLDDHCQALLHKGIVKRDTEEL